MRLPILIASRDMSVDAYESTAEAESSVESADVEGGEYIGVFDADGLRMRFEEPARRDRSPWWKFKTIHRPEVRIVPSEDVPTGAEELRRHLVKWILGAPSDARLDQLIALLPTRQGHGERPQWPKS